MDGSPEDETRAPYGRVGEQALDRLRAMIWNGDLTPGEHLRQDELANRFGVSRVPMREVFKVLVSEGLLTHRRNHGHYVSDPSSHELAQVLWMRESVESHLARTAMWPGPEEHARLHRLNEQLLDLAELRPNDKASVIVADFAFHSALWNLSDEKLVVAEMTRLWGMFAPFRAFMPYTAAVTRRMHTEHDQILAAVAAQDRSLFADLMLAHQVHTHVVVDQLRDRERELENPAADKGLLVSAPGSPPDEV